MGINDLENDSLKLFVPLYLLEEIHAHISVGRSLIHTK